MASLQCTNCHAVLNRPPTATLGQLLRCASCGANFVEGGPVERTSRWAIWSFVLGLLTVPCAFFAGLPAVVCGAVALNEIDSAGEFTPRRGRQLALIGMLLGVLGNLALPATLFVTQHYRNQQRITDRRERRQQRQRQAPLPHQHQQEDYRQTFDLLTSPETAQYRWMHPINGVDPAQDDADFHETFANLNFDDSSWVADDDKGGEGFGYGDDYRVNIGKPTDGRRYTAYFRIHFQTQKRYERFIIELAVDDGAIIYLDGQRGGAYLMDNRPEGYRILTSGRSSEGRVRSLALPVTLEPGEHVLAISVHNSGPDSSDLGLARVSLYGRPVESAHGVEDATSGLNAD